MGQQSIFVSYSHADEVWLDRLLVHLRVLSHQDLLNVWTDRQIVAGSDWYEEIQAALRDARIAILLVSPSYLGSAFVREEEVPRLLARREQEGLAIVPVVVRPCSWQLVPWLSSMQLRPTEARPLSEVSEAQVDRDLASLTQEIYGLLTEGQVAPVWMGAIDDDSANQKAWRPLGDDESLDEFAKMPGSISEVAGAVEVAWKWYAALRHGDFETAWSLGDDNWRLCRAQAWIWNNRKLLGLNDLAACGEMAEVLRAVGSTHPLSRAFLSSERAQFMEALSSHSRMGMASLRRSVGPGFELFILTPLGEEFRGIVVEKPTPIHATLLLMHFTLAGWRGAGYGANSPPLAGWPPAWWHRDPVAATVTDELLRDGKASDRSTGTK